MLRRSLFTVSLTMIMHCAAAQPIPEAGDAWQAAYAVDMQSGEVLYDYNASLPMTPASMTKLFTTAAALELLGDTARITTRACYDPDGQCLYIIGHADPTFDSQYYRWHSAAAFADKIADALSTAQVNSLRAVHADCGYIGGAPYPSARLWDDMGNYYGATPRALNYSDNTFLLKLNSPARVGELCTVAAVEPPVGHTMECYCRSYAGRRDSAYIYGVADGGWYVSGAIPAGRTDFVVKGAMPRPELEFCRAVAAQLRKRGINITDEVSVATCPTAAKQIAAAQSPTIAAIVKSTNQHSINLYADALLLQLTDSIASWDACLHRLREFVVRSTGRDAVLCDGSGLSPRNAITARQFADLLLYMDRSPRKQAFFNSLAVSGQDGTLRNFAKGTRLEGRIKAKSGTLTDALGYAGIVDSGDRRIAFCIIVNKQNTRNDVIRKAITRWLLRLTDSNINANTLY